MAALPKRRISTRRQGKRRARHGLGLLPSLAKCSYCGQAKIPFTLCPNCKRY